MVADGGNDARLLPPRLQVSPLEPGRCSQRVDQASTCQHCGSPSPEVYWSLRGGTRCRKPCGRTGERSMTSELGPLACFPYLSRCSLGYGMTLRAAITSGDASMLPLLGVYVKDLICVAGSPLSISRI
jgi:hypothetical protein